MEKPSSNQPQNEQYNTDPSHLRPEGMEEGRQLTYGLELRLSPHPETTKRYREKGLDSSQEMAIKSHIMDNLSSKRRKELHHFSEEWNEDLIKPEDVKDIRDFLHSMGLDTKPIYLVKEEYGSAENIGSFVSVYDHVLIKQEPFLKFRGAQKLILGNIAHELAHSSSQYGIVYSHDLEMRPGVIDIGQPKIREERNGMRNGMARKSEDEKLDQGNYGTALEECFADYISLLYLRKIDYNCYDFADDIYIDNELSERGLNSTSYLDGLIANANTYEERSKCIIEVLKKIDHSKGTPYLSPRSIIVPVEKGGLLFQGYPLLAASLDLLVLDDPSLLQSFIRGRKDVQGLREVAQKLNALEPGLYVKLRNLGRSDEDQFEFYKTVVEVLSKKYFPDGQPNEGNMNEDITQNPH